MLQFAQITDLCPRVLAPQLANSACQNIHKKLMYVTHMKLSKPMKIQHPRRPRGQLTK
jgi:hypothetical protein